VPNLGEVVARGLEPRECFVRASDLACSGRATLLETADAVVHVCAVQERDVSRDGALRPARVDVRVKYSVGLVLEESTAVVLRIANVLQDSDRGLDDVGSSAKRQPRNLSKRVGDVGTAEVLE